MAVFSVELLLEIEANTAEDAAELALLEVRTATEPLTVSVYSEAGVAVDVEPDEVGSVRHWRRITIEPALMVTT
jgi:hypothetical protein